MAGLPDKQYRVRFRTLAGAIQQEGVVAAQSPRQAVDVSCKCGRRAVSNVTKYGSWVDLRRAAILQGGNYSLCEVVGTREGRKNFYIVCFGGF